MKTHALGQCTRAVAAGCAALGVALLGALVVHGTSAAAALGVLALLLTGLTVQILARAFARRAAAPEAAGHAARLGLAGTSAVRDDEAG